MKNLSSMSNKPKRDRSGYRNIDSPRTKRLKLVETLNNTWLQKKLTSPSIKRV